MLRAHTSIFGVYSSSEEELKNSGDMYGLVPRCVDRIFDWVANPKSAILSMPSFSRMFSVLMSRWQMPIECR